MPTVQELLKSSGLTEEIVAGLPKEAISAFSGIMTDAETKLSTATQESKNAEESRRQAELERAEVQKYVEDYGTQLTKMTSAEAKLAAANAYFKKLKEDGFDVPGDLLGDPESGEGKKSVVPGSPALGGNAVDEGKILGKVGSVMSQWLDANNEHIRLYGTPIPDPSTNIAEEAARARKPVGEYIAEKYKFRERQTAKQAEDFQKRVDAAAALKIAEHDRVEAEKRGSNPNLRPGESSRSSFVPKIKGEEFHKSDGNVPRRERERRMLDNLHKEVAEIRGVA